MHADLRIRCAVCATVCMCYCLYVLLYVCMYVCMTLYVPYFTTTLCTELHLPEQHYWPFQVSHYPEEETYPIGHG